MTTTLLAADRLAAACRDSVAAVAESLNVCFDRTGEFVVGEVRSWDAPPPERLSGPGLAVSVVAGDAGFVALLPADLLPDWFAQPDDAQKSRLGGLSAEWSLALLPEGAAADATDAVTVSDLTAAADACGPAPDAALIPFFPADAASDGDGGDDPAGTFYLLGPIARTAQETRPASRRRQPAGDVERASGGERERSGERSNPQADAGGSPGESNGARRLRRLLPIPVQVVVYLAEKPIEMGQLLSLAPGSLITFNKNCEEYLDLYVNNRLYCRGEAVKIGEKFGLKVNDVGGVKRREERVF